jgi:hypothetical protein
MAIHPVGDQVLVLLDKEAYNFGGKEGEGSETGVVVELSKGMWYIGMHSFAFEKSVGDDVWLESIQTWLEGEVLNKRVYWEALQDRGRRIKDGDNEYVLLKITDIIAVDDDVNNKARIVSQTGKAGSFAV